MLLMLGWFELWTQYPGSVVPLAMFWYRQTHSSYHLKIIIVIITIIIIPASWILETLCGGTPTSSTTSRSGTPAPPSILFSTFQVKSNKSLQMNNKTWTMNQPALTANWTETTCADCATLFLQDHHRLTSHQARGKPIKIWNGCAVAYFKLSTCQKL